MLEIEYFQNHHYYDAVTVTCTYDLYLKNIAIMQLNNNFKIDFEPLVAYVYLEGNKVFIHKTDEKYGELVKQFIETNMEAFNYCASHNL